MKNMQVKSARSRKQKRSSRTGAEAPLCIFMEMKLKEIRTQKKISIPRLSELTGIPIRTLEDIQKRGDCLLSNAAKIAVALGVSLDDLCTC